MNLYRSLQAASLLVLLATGAGCMGTSDVSDNGKGVTGVSVAPDEQSVTKGKTLQLKATVEYADGTSRDVTGDADTVWNSSDASIASVSRTGLVTTVSEGVVDISADFKGEKGNEHFAVTP